MTDAGAARPRAITAPAAALHALRTALLAAPDGELRLRDAGYVAGLAMYDDFVVEVRDAREAAPDAMPLARFVDALVAYLDACGWGAARIDARPGASTLRVSSSDWFEGEPDAESTYPTCHFSTGLLAGFFGRAAGRSLAVLETACRSAGAAECEFAVGSREVLEMEWNAMRAARDA